MMDKDQKKEKKPRSGKATRARRIARTGGAKTSELRENVSTIIDGDRDVK